MKQYVKPDFCIIEILEDLLTISAGGDQANGIDNLVFDWNDI